MRKFDKNVFSQLGLELRQLVRDNKYKSKFLKTRASRFGELPHDVHFGQNAEFAMSGQVETQPG